MTPQPITLHSLRVQRAIAKNTMVFIAKMSGMKSNMVLICSRQKTKEVNIELAQCMEKKFLSCSLQRCAFNFYVTITY
jgi:hypothetical protein